MLLGSFDELAGLEHGAGADERDQVGCVHGAPAGLGGLDELKCHGQPGRPRSRPAGDLGPVSYGPESGFNGVGGAQVNPVLGGVVVEREQLL